MDTKAPLRGKALVRHAICHMAEEMFGGIVLVGAILYLIYEIYERLKSML